MSKLLIVVVWVLGIVGCFEDGGRGAATTGPQHFDEFCRLVPGAGSPDDDPLRCVPKGTILCSPDGKCVVAP
jgi:hypothetical protein